MANGGWHFWAVGVLAVFLLPAAHFAAWLALICVLLLVCGIRRRGRAAWWLLAGVLYGVWRIQAAVSGLWPAEPEAQRVEMVFQVASVAEETPYAVRFEALAETADGRRFRLLLSDRFKREWLPGSRWQMQARVRPAIGERNDNGFDREAWALSRGLDGLASAGAVRTELAADGGWRSRWLQWRYRAQQRWQQAAIDYPEGAALMRALGTGGYGGLEDAHWQAFRHLGINHLVSISGLHVGMTALAAGLLARLLLWPLPLAEPRRWVLAAGLAAAAVYGALAGFGVPVQRSLLMLAVFVWHWWQRSGVSPWQSWWLALSAVLLWQPLSALGVGFWLSFGMVAVLIWAGNGRLRPGKWRALWRGQAAVTLFGFWAAGRAFGIVPLAAPLANMVLIPWFSWLLVPLALLAVLLPGDGLLLWAAAAGEYTLRAIEWAGGQVPLGSLPHLPLLFWLAVPSALAVLFLPRGLGLRPWAALVLLFSCFYRSPAPAPNTAWVRVYDVGQGLAVQIRTHRHWLLFDTGTESAANMQLFPAIRAQGLPPPDILVASHHDADHDGGLHAFRLAWPNALLYAGQPDAYPPQQTARHCQGGLHWLWDGVWFEFLTPPPQGGQADNEQSCVLRVVAGGEAVLITGDLGKAGERELLRLYGSSLHSQILLLGHHGSRSSTATEFLDVVAPHTAIATNGFANPYRHPAAEVRHSLSARGIRLYTSARSGQIDFLLGSGQAGRPQLLPRRFWQRKPLSESSHELFR